MKSPISPERIRGSIEPLEARIAPATIYVGDPNFTNNLDTEYIELNPHAGQTLFFVNTSKASIDPRVNPEGDPTLKADDVISQAVDGNGVGTYYLRMTAGDVVYRFTDNGYKELVRVRVGSAIGFFTDYNHNIEYDDGEFSGISLGPNASVLVSEKLFGDAVTNLNTGRSVSSRDDMLDMTGLVSFRQGIRSLAVSGGSIFSGDSLHYGKVLSGGTIAQLSVGGGVEGVYAGTAAIGKTYDFFPGVPGGEGAVTNYSVPKYVAGASIFNAKVLRVNDGLYAGDGGFGGSGGALVNIQITQDTDGMILKSGNGGAADFATRALYGGAGGTIRSVVIAGLLDSTPNSAVLTQKIQILAGDGGVGLANTRGGVGGSEGSIFIGYEVNGSKLIDSADLLRDTVLLQAGAGGNGAIGGSGGAIVSSKIRVQTPNAVGDEISIIGGKGGDSLSTTGTAGLGGAILNVDARNQELTYDSGLLVQGGDGGATTGSSFGARGGSLTSVILQGFDIQALAGDGSNGKVGGVGGSIINLFVTRDENQLILTHNATINAGKGGDSSRGRGGAGGVINGVTFDKVDVQNLSINSGVQGDGGSSGLSVGGGGGFVRNVTVIDSDSGIGIEGLINIRAGDGADGYLGGGAGGSLIRTSVTAINANLQTKSGEGGNSTRAGSGGAGGLLDTVQLSSEGVVANSFVFGTAVAGSGGDGMGQFGRGGIGGGARFVDLNMVANTLRTDVSGGGYASLTAGTGGNGQSNFFNSRGVLNLGGAPGRGGSVFVSGLFAEVGAASMIAGDAGADGNGPASGGIIIGEGNNVKLVGLRALTSLYAKGGDGSHGGAGGGISNLSYGSTAASLSPTPQGDIIIQGGKGSMEGRVAGMGGSLKLIDGAISSNPQSLTGLYAGDGGGVVPASLPVTELVMGTGADREVQVIDVGSLAGIASANFTLGFGASKTGYLSATRLNVLAIQAELNRIFPAGAPTASLDPLNPSQLKITFATTGDQPAIVATGYNGIAAAAGGSVSDVSIFLGGGQDVEFKVEAGDGGGAGPVGRTGGSGGSILRVGMAAIDAATIVRSFGAGDGGDARVFGGRGGGVYSVAVQDHDIGVRSGLAYGYTEAGGIFAGVGGHSAISARGDGAPGSVIDINANSIASIVAGKSLIPQMAARVSAIFLNDDVQLVTRDGALVSNKPFTLTFEENTTDAIPGNANPADPIPGNATREQVQGFLNLLPAVQSSGVGQNLWIAESTPGTASVNEVQTIYLGGIAGHSNATFQLTFGTDSATFGANALATDIESALNSLASVQTAGGVTVTGVPSGPYKVTFNVPNPQPAFTGKAFENLQITETIPGGAQAEVQTINLGVIAGHSNGTFQLTFGTDSATFAANASASTVSLGLNGLGSVQAVNGVSVTGNPGGPYTVTFGNTDPQDPISGLGFESGSVSVSYGSSGSYIVSFDSNGNQVLLSGEEYVPLDVTTTVGGQIVGDATTEVVPGAVNLGVVTTLDGELVIPVVEAVSGSTTFISGEQIRGSASALPPILEVQRLDLSTLLSYPTGRVNLTFDDPASGTTGTTGLLGPNITAAQLRQALSALPSIAAVGGVNVQQVNFGIFDVTFVTPADQPAIAGQFFLPEKQQVFLGNIATTPGAKFTLAYDPGAGATSTTTPIDGNALPGAVDAALEALPSIQGLAGTPGNKVTVTSAQPGVLDITFNSIDEKNPFVATGFVQETQQVDLGSLTASPTGTYRLSYNGILTAPIPVTADAATIDGALEAISSIVALGGTAADKVGVTKVANSNLLNVTFKSNGDKLLLEAIGARPEVQDLDVSQLATTNGSEFTLTVRHNLNVTTTVEGKDGVANPPPFVATQTPGEFNLSIPETVRGTAALSEVQTINLGAVAGKPAATFTLTYGLDPSVTLLSTDNAQTVQNALNGIQGIIDAGFVTVTGNVGGPFRVTFTTAGDQANISGIGDVPEVQVVELANLRSTLGGQFTLTYGADTTGPLDRNATLAQVDAALEGLGAILALNGPAANKVTVAVGTGGREYQVTFNGIGDKEEMTITAGGTADREVQVLDISPLLPYGAGANSRFNLSFNGDNSAILAGDATAGNIDAVLEAIPSIAALGPGGNNVTVTATGTAGVFQIAFNTFGDQPLISGLSQVGPSSTQIGTTLRLAGDADAADIKAAVDAVSQVPVIVTPGTVAGTFSIMFNENGDQPTTFVTEYFHETQVLDLYAVGKFQVQFGLEKSARLEPNISIGDLDTVLEGMTTIQALPGPVGDKVEVAAGPNSSYIVLFHGDGNVQPLLGTQFLDFKVSNEINGFNRDGSQFVKEQQVLNYYNKRAFNADFFNTAAPDPFLPPPAHPPGNLVGSISDINELDANVFHYIRNNVVMSTFDGDFQLGDQPIDGLIMAKLLDQRTLNFTPEARYVLKTRFVTKSFFDNDNII